MSRPVAFLKRAAAFSHRWVNAYFESDRFEAPTIPHVSVETTNICNAKCVFCANPVMERRKQPLSMEHFEKFVGGFVAMGGTEIDFNATIGEPTLDPHLIERARLLHKIPHIQNIGFVTTLQWLHKHPLDAFFDCGITWLAVSCTLSGREKYLEFFGVDCYEQMLDNLITLLEENRRRGGRDFFYCGDDYNRSIHGGSGASAGRSANPRGDRRQRQPPRCLVSLPRLWAARLAVSRLRPCSRTPRTCAGGPEALSRFYHEDHKSIGASWVTREDREREMEDYVHYLDLLHEQLFELIELIDRASVRLVVLGFSQGAATAARWAVRSRVDVDHLVLWGAATPPERDDDTALAPLKAMRVTLVGGSRDALFPESAREEQRTRLRRNGVTFSELTFAGEHRLDDETLPRLAAS